MTYRNYSKHNSMLAGIDIRRHYMNNADKVVPLSLSSDGSIVAIGAAGNDGVATSAGHVRIYKYNGTAWTQMGVDIDGEAFADMSGYSVSLSSDGNTVAIGAYQNDGNGSSAGHTRIYEYNGTVWTQIGADIDGEAADDYSGYSISLSSDGNTVAIGAYGNDGNGSNVGHVRIYEYNGTVWTQIGADIDGDTLYDMSGMSVSLSSDGNTVAVGAPNNDGNGANAGHTKIHSLNTYNTIVEIACDTFISPSGNYVWTTSGNYLDTLPNAFGADSIITTDLTVNYSNTSIDTQTACFSYLWIDGNTYTSNNNVATHTINNAAGCDSVVTLDLTINTVDVAVTVNSITLTAMLSGASYQWIDCDNSNLSIAGETAQSFTPSVNGSYAVIIDDGSCVDTSACYDISGVGIYDDGISSVIAIYPNPTGGLITVECEEMESLEILDITGKVVCENAALYKGILNIDISAFSKGVYFVRVRTEDGVAVERIVLE
jgi:Secretion system C-terminal sorting domain/FG-GAP repeat